ncbi:WXG100 family type VII secretion target [Nocardia sp. NPDC057440]|uniref:WXG100 family type VII secretion target n=1 Tax=Nocardia sp. NPDC057440 TaxID=3346134 RepID=UPI0036703AA7
MTDRGYVANLSEIQDLVDAAARITERIDQGLGEVDRAIDSLHIGWSGEAANAHRAKHDEWRAAAREMHEGLGLLTAAVQRAHDLYVANGLHLQGMWPE